MLPSELLRVTSRGGEVRPRFVDPADEEALELASTVLDAFAAAAREGWTVGRAEDELEELAATTDDPKLFRGLVKVARDRCELEADAELDAPSLRLEVFRRSAARGPLALTSDAELGHVTAEEVLGEVAAERGLTTERLRAALYAALPSERRIVSCGVPSAAWLVDRYNVALVQGVLLGAVRVEVLLRDPTVARMRQLFRWVKFHQLLHRAEKGEDGLRVVLDGPVSLFAASTRYGLQLARFFPALLLQDGGWELTATVSWTRARHRRELRLSDAAGLRSHYEDRGSWRPKAVEHFVARFAEEDRGWTLSETTRPLRGGRGALVFPDFTLHRDEREVHVEVLGWWRHDSLEKRLAELREHGPRDLVLAVSRRLRAGPAGELPEDPRLLSFADALPVRTVVAAAERLLANPA